MVVNLAPSISFYMAVFEWAQCLERKEDFWLVRKVLLEVLNTAMTFLLL